jgi:regulator of protease activity HflC (stomatin/prohibitin superfamily)
MSDGDQASNSINVDLSSVQNWIRRLVFWFVFLGLMALAVNKLFEGVLPSIDFPLGLPGMFVGPWIEYSVVAVVVSVIASALAGMIYVLPEWQRAIILRMGRFDRVAGPGAFILLPLVWSVARIVTLRTVTVAFTAEQTLTKDKVPVNVEAVLFYEVEGTQAQKCIMQVDDYEQAVLEKAQVALRNAISESSLTQLLTEREHLAQNLQSTLDEVTETWGVNIGSVGIKDIVIPDELQVAMASEARSISEGHGRIAAATAELDASGKYLEAAKLYDASPAALRLREMAMLVELTKNGAQLIVVPSDAVSATSPLTLAALKKSQE